MDVRAIDTSALAAKRIEMDRIRPVGAKDKGSSEFKIDGRHKDEREGRHAAQGEDTHGHGEGEDGEESSPTSNAEPGEGHILDALA